jgi:hypothetical protein
MAHEEFVRARYIPKGAKWDPLLRWEFMYRLRFPSQRKHFPDFTIYHATVEEALTEAERVCKLLPSWGEPDCEPFIFLKDAQIFPERG